MTSLYVCNTLQNIETSCDLVMAKAILGPGRKKIPQTRYFGEKELGRWKMSGQMSQLLPIDEIAKITEVFFY